MKLHRIPGNTLVDVVLLVTRQAWGAAGGLSWRFRKAFLRSPLLLPERLQRAGSALPWAAILYLVPVLLSIPRAVLLKVFSPLVLLDSFFLNHLIHAIASKIPAFAQIVIKET